MTIQISDAVRDFLLQRIRTVERLDVLLYLFRHGTRWWAAENLATEIGMPPHAVQEHLEALSTVSLLDVRITDEVRYSLQPARPELTQLVAQIAEAHYAQRDALLARLARPRGSVELFAEAFKWRRGKKT